MRTPKRSPLPCLAQRAWQSTAASAALLAALLPAPVAAESSLLFSVPKKFESLPAVTYDSNGEPLGTASMSVEWIDPETARLVGTVTIDSGGGTRVQADFRLVDEGRHFKVIRQISESVTAEGRSLGTLLIEHEKGTATCTPPADTNGEARQLKLPEPDRVANVPLHLLFAPLAKGHANKVDFDILLCRDEPRFMDFAATVVERDGGAPDVHSVEIQYGPDLGSLLSFFASGMIPELRFWLDGENDDRYLAHRMPLYSDGPEVWVIREGVTPRDLRSELRSGAKPRSPTTKEAHHESGSHSTGR